MKLKSVFSFFIAVLLGWSVAAQEASEITDPRDGKTYKVVTIDIELEGGVFIKRTWMAQNLNFEVPDSYCYKDEPAYCEAYGRLYTFEAAVAACPEGWHVPTIGEWNLLFQTYDGIRQGGLHCRKTVKAG